MKAHLIAYLVGLVTLGLLDALWLGWLAADFYQSQLGHLMAPAPRLGAALVFYLMYPAGLLLFAVRPALADGGPRRAAALGAAFGGFAYATYDLTNLATLRDWPIGVAMLDIAWGIAISALVAWAACRGAVGAAARSRR